MSTPRTPAAVPLTPRRASKMASNQSLNHLLNFTLPPRQTQPLPSLPRRSRKTGTHQGVWNKERFVNAQYRFVMNPNGDYTVHFADPDMQAFAMDILQVIIPRSSALASASANGERVGQDEGHTTCPICLSPPTAPRMTKCGHVFCFPCILHYLNTSENKWARCPICFDSVNEKQLKSVKWFDGPAYHEEDTEGPAAGSSSSGSMLETAFETTPRTGSTMRMRLMQRPQITTLALPRSHTWPSDLLPPHQAPFHFLPDVFDYAKFMLATPSYLVADLTQDLNELASERRILSGMTDDLGILFVDAADEKIRRQIAKATALETTFLRERIDKAIRDQHEIEERAAFHANRRKQEAAMRTPTPGDAPEEFIALKSGPEPLTTGRSTPRQRRKVNPPPPSTSTYYYYQAASGLPLFLHPLDIKILLSHFSSYSAFPDVITIRVDGFSEGTEGADVVFVEADLAEVVGGFDAGLKNFEERARVRGEEREREKERSVFSATVPSATWRFTGDAADTPGLDEQELPPQPPVEVSGAWGPPPRRQEPDEDDWDMDAAWHELESRSGGGKSKRNKKLVVLGGGPGRRGR
ncbi:hypothetical protein C8J57DRAFT_1266931 [Mycena rebaudengoi]|nr:hypothetical protein C8J57DRAFT_1266931 [Mycena rebaudengoi]